MEIILLLSIIACGFFLGFFIRQYNLPGLESIIQLLIYVMLFCLGLSVGTNSTIIENLPILGGFSALLMVANISGSIIFTSLLIRLFKAKNDAIVKNKTNTDKKGTGNYSITQLKGCAFTLLSFVAGILSGYHILFFKQIPDYTLEVLYIIMALVGISLGHESAILKQFREFKLWMLLLPFATFTGSLAGSVIIAFCQSGYQPQSILAIGSGMAYYSLTSVIVSQTNGVELGTIALLSNVLREFCVITMTPLLAILFGKLAPITCGGATTMDTTLPIIIRTCGESYTPLALYHGCVCTCIVPVIVPMLTSL